MTQRYLDISDIIQQTAAQVQKDNACTETYALIHAATRLSAHGAYDAGDVGEVRPDDRLAVGVEREARGAVVARELGVVREQLLARCLHVGRTRAPRQCPR